MNDYLLTHKEAIMNVAETLFGDGQIKTGTQVSKHFGGTMHEMHSTMDFLCDHCGLVKVSQTIRLTPKGRQNVEEIAYIMPKE